MTIKQIAELTGKSNRRVQEWAQSIGAKTASIGAKTASIKRNSPADFTLEETISIMKAGGVSESMISLLRDNAHRTQSAEYVTKSDLVDFAKAIVSETMKQFIPLLQQKPQMAQIEYVQDYYSITGYAIKNKIQITFSETQKYGKIATKLSVMRNKKIRKVDDERWGEVGSYHIDILKEVFSL